MADEATPCSCGSEKVKRLKEIRATQEAAGGDCTVSPAGCTFLGKVTTNGHEWCVFECPEGEFWIPCW